MERRPLAQHIPSAGLRFLVRLSPKQLLASEVFVEDWSVVFQADRLQAFAAVSGVQLEDVEEAWIAGYELGMLYLYDARSSGIHAERAFRDRALTTREVQAEYANLTHVTGMVEQTPHALIHVHDHFIAIAVGDIRLARVVRAYAEGKLKKSPPALESTLLATHAGFDEGAPIHGYLVGPFEEATDAVASGFVSGVASVNPTGGLLEIHAQALGLWPASDSLSRRLTVWTNELLSTREFRALGWGFPHRPPEIDCARPDAPEELVPCSASGSWDSGEVAQALYRITSGSLAEITGDAPKNWKPEAGTGPISPPTNESEHDESVNKAKSDHEESTSSN